MAASPWRRPDDATSSNSVQAVRPSFKLFPSVEDTLWPTTVSRQGPMISKDGRVFGKADPAYRSREPRYLRYSSRPYPNRANVNV